MKNIKLIFVIIALLVTIYLLKTFFPSLKSEASLSQISAQIVSQSSIKSPDTPIKNKQQSSSEHQTTLEAGLVNPGYVEKPDWFKVSFLDLFEDIDDASDDNKRLMIYYYQDGCPYCEKMMKEIFYNETMAKKIQQYFDVVPINLWGDKEVVVGDKTYTEKEFAQALKIQYTPTILFFNENKKIIFKANGYYPPNNFTALLDYIGKKQETKVSYQHYVEKFSPEKSSGQLHNTMNTVSVEYNFEKVLSDNPDKHLLVMFEKQNCNTCDEMHLDILKRKVSLALLKKFEVAVVDMYSEKEVTSPKGEKITLRNMAKKLNIKYTPSFIFFNKTGDEIFRAEGYLKAFHVQSILDYIASNAYKKQSNFQRYIDIRAEHLREQGIEVDLMK